MAKVTRGTQTPDKIVERRIINTRGKKPKATCTNARRGGKKTSPGTRRQAVRDTITGPRTPRKAKGLILYGHYHRFMKKADPSRAAQEDQVCQETSTDEHESQSEEASSTRHRQNFCVIL